MDIVKSGIYMIITSVVSTLLGMFLFGIGFISNIDAAKILLVGGAGPLITLGLVAKLETLLGVDA